ncbi:hypothetical protein [Belnapia moabensis]|nr:hypothetical protein [Belnapia moabensis]
MGHMFDAAADVQRINGDEKVGLGRYIATNSLGLAWLLGLFWFLAQ